MGATSRRVRAGATQEATADEVALDRLVGGQAGTGSNELLASEVRTAADGARAGTGDEINARCFKEAFCREASGLRCNRGGGTSGNKFSTGGAPGRRRQASTPGHTGPGGCDGCWRKMTISAANGTIWALASDRGEARSGDFLRSFTGLKERKVRPRRVRMAAHGPSADPANKVHAHCGQP
ncbi:MAG: hypothetical protein COA68_17665 [Oceanobacter sp.]|nr:MAG: hypothetical protein COA68_17665 [Oceanobacter sp.]